MYLNTSFRRVALTTVVALLLVLPLQTASHAATVTYEHDTHGRMSKATYSDGTIIDYSYDDNGNRTATVVTPGTPIPPDTTPPTAPGTPTFSSITGTSATASWTAATDNVGVTGYDYRLNSGSWQSISNVLTLSLAGLTSVASYTFAVRARDAAGNLGPQSSGSFSTPDAAAPTVPTNVSAASSVSTTVNVSWTASTDNVAVTGYKVFRNGSQVGTSTTASYADNTVSGSTAYSYKVSARDAANNESAQSAAANVTTPDTIAPTTPTSLTATTASPSQINLSWGASSDAGGSGLAGYRVYRDGSQIATTTATSYSDAGLASSTAYSYTVASYDNATPTNTSAQSNTAGATTWGPVTASLSATLWRWRRTGTNPIQVDPPVVCTPSGGSGAGYTYSWQYVSGDTATSVVGGGGNAATWSRSMPSNGTFESTWRCVVTDSGGNTGESPTVLVRFVRNTLQ
jgi:chitodextrinase